MKKMIRNFLAVVMVIGFTVSAYAGDPYIRVKQKGSKEFFLFIDHSDIGNDGTVIRLKDSKGEKFYKERFKDDEDYTKLYNLNALPNGDYILEIEGESTRSSWSLHITREGLKLEKASELNPSKSRIALQTPNKSELQAYRVSLNLDHRIFNPFLAIA